MNDRALRVTFYSYKGGVGRTLALLNVAEVLARAGRRVVAVDLDLEAPGFGLSSATEGPAGGLGASDLLLDRRADAAKPTLSIHDCVYPILTRECEDRLQLMPVGRRAAKLSRSLPELYADPAGDEAFLFQLLVAEIEDELEPDYILFDSRTGRADIAGVSTLELPRVVVAVCGLNDQNIRGMESMLARLTIHPARIDPVATVLVLSPVPRASDLGVRSVKEELAVLPPRTDLATMLAPVRRANPLLDRVWRAQAHLLPTVTREFAAVRESYPDVDPEDLYHELPYDPWVPLVDELSFSRDRASSLSLELSNAYRRLARSLTRFHPNDDELDRGAEFSRPTTLAGLEPTG